ncbi:MAG: 2-phosphosulfolactate phosphatase [Steroidobacteraceae bacterium]
MPKLHVLLKRQEIDPARLDDKVVVVLDVLFATTTIVHAFSKGVASIHPVRSRDEAMRIAEQVGTCVLAGEFMAQAIPGFAPATPVALASLCLNGAEMVYCTTNGTQTLVSVAHAPHVYVGAFLNGKALAAHVVTRHPQASVLIVCSGTLDRFNLEDFHAAGHVIAHLVQIADYTLTDAAIAALYAYRGCDTRTALFASRVGQMMESQALGCEVDYASTHDTIDVVPTLVDGRLVRAAT